MLRRVKQKLREQLQKTTLPAVQKPGKRRDEPQVGLTLVIAWYPQDSSRVGELAVAPTSDRVMVLGRHAIDDEPRMLFVRPEPGRFVPMRGLEAPTLSRRQLEVQNTAEGLAVSNNPASCELRVNGVPCTHATVTDGDVLVLGEELVLLCRKRPLPTRACERWPHVEQHKFGQPDVHGMIGESPALWRLRERLAFAADSNRHVLITGESGSGKELAARALHQLSARASRALVARNAKTIPSGLIDAEFFGHAQNYPNAGVPERSGLLGEADGGMLFLDELGDLSEDAQASLLRVLDPHGEYQRLGEAKRRYSDYVLIGATNRDPQALREEMQDRLPLNVHVPALHERLEDIPLLARHLVLTAARNSPRIAARFVDKESADVRIHVLLIERMLLERYRGNTRSLDALLMRAMEESSGTDIIEEPASARNVVPKVDRPQPVTHPDEVTVEEIRRALKAANGKVARASEQLGFANRYVLYRLLEKHGIDPDRD